MKMHVDKEWSERQATKPENEEFPRACIDRFTPAERAIYDAMGLVEAMGADVRLTDAVVALGKARESVADFVDGVPRRRQ